MQARPQSPRRTVVALLFFLLAIPLYANTIRNGYAVDDTLFITDNVLWSGRVARPASKDAETRAIQKFNRLIYRSPKLFTTVIPLRDGFAVCEKLQ